MAPPERLTIAHVTPHSWGPHNEVNEFVARSAAELAARGHSVLVAAPSESRAEIRATRAALREARRNPEALLDGGWTGTRVDGDGPAVLAVGQGLPLPRGPSSQGAPVTLDSGRPLGDLLSSIPFDVVHVHDPFMPTTAWAALRHSRSLNVGSFHEPTERVLSTELARPLVEIFLGRLDARTVSCGDTERLMERYFPGRYELLTPGADPPGEPWWPFDAAKGRLRILYCAREERGALRLFLRALRRLPLELAWEAVVWSDRAAEQPLRLNRGLRERVRSLGPHDAPLERLVAAAGAVCLASGGSRTAPAVARAALAAGAIPVVSRVPHVELTADGDAGLLFPPGDAVTLAGQLARLCEEPELRDGLARRGAGSVPGWSEVANRLEGIYGRICARRHDPSPNPALRRRIAARPTIECDLHMHTDHSADCATPVEVLLETARDRGLGAIAVTDHNEISGALAAREAAERIGGIKVIVGEEVKTAEQGEVIGLFLSELIPRGLTMAETIAEIRRQGGLVYVPHPFDRFHSVPDYEHLLDIVEDVDILEVFNPRVAFSAFNDEAERFAAKYRIVPGAGSDGHVAQALGSVRIRLHEFEGPEEFLEAMRDADIVRKHKNLVYVQALKLLQDDGRPRGRGPSLGPGREAGARRARRERRRGARAGRPTGSTGKGKK